MTKLTEKQTQLLYNLHNNGGSIQGKDLSTPFRSIASRLNMLGLVRWEPIGGRLLAARSEQNLDNWRLHITDKGRTAIGKETA